MQVIIFTDLDGCLLDHDDYSCEAAKPSLERIKRSAIPLIIATSKTRSEVEILRRDLGLRDPFIVENGGGIFFPLGYRNLIVEGGELEGDYTIVRLGVPYPIVRGFLERMKERFAVRGFGDLTSAEIAELTGLSPEQAERAKTRDFTEPFVLEREEDIVSLRELAAAEGIRITRGGRFFHLIGIRQDKGEAIRIACNILRKSTGHSTTIGLGDSENDLPMLRQVDIPVVIPHPERGYMNVALPGLIRAKEPGSRGWNEAVERLLNQLELREP
ncbi:MAG: mannosyl-3-phosphoglycerate phosphatase [Syntrophobacterales bacterium RBG_19FT_COMBO_59_10]|nr:MAG: mannosyl-3-phosphoglycerate phosphatase [Syntrophobacterales bacterium RBG_19FT_COMBO_59_10]